MTQSNDEPQSEVTAFVAQVERVLRKRQEEARKGIDRRRLRHDSTTTEGLKKWTFDELYYQFGPFRDMRKNPEKYRRPPTNADARLVADLLLCNVDERNDILIAAGYAPEQPNLHGKELADALKPAEYILHYLPLPAYICTRDWNIHGFNQGCSVLFGITEEIFQATPKEERNALWYIFDPSNPIHHALNQDQELWELTARVNLHWFKRENQLHQYDEWYVNFVKRLGRFPGFVRIWEEVEVERYDDLVKKLRHPPYVTEIFTEEGERLRIRGLQIFSLDSEYPRVIAFIPDDDESREVFTQLGFPTPQNWWGYKQD